MIGNAAEPSLYTGKGNALSVEDTAVVARRTK